MQNYKIIQKDIIEFWKQEKAVAFLNLCSLTLYFESLLFRHGEKIWERGMCGFFTNGKLGILQATIFIGYLLIWHYGLEERKTAWVTFNILGMKKRNIFIALQMEMIVFQFLAILFTCLFFLGYSLWGGHASLHGYLFELVLNCLELQILGGIGETLYLKK